MKYVVFNKIILIIIQCCLFICILTVCFSCAENEGEAELTIINQSSITFSKISWRGTSFGALSPGDEVTKNVNGIEGVKVFFDLYIGKTEYFTEEEILVEPGSYITFVFTDNTEIYTFE